MGRPRRRRAPCERGPSLPTAITIALRTWALQEQAVRCFKELVEEAPAELRDVFVGCLEYAVAHRDIIARFGRFPHRNAILGRVSTPEEIAFLKQPGSSF